MAEPRKPSPAAATPPIQPVSVTDSAPTGNAYYGKVSARYRAAQYLTLFLVVLLILAGFVTGSDSITYQNFIYLLRDFDTVLGTGGERVNEIRYNAADTREYLLYREGLTLVDRTSVEIYNASGRRTLEDTPGFDNPRALPSEQYMLVYDLGGKSYALYNSLARIYTGTLDFAISGGAVSDSGLYAIVTRTREYDSAVLLYGRNNKLKNRFLKDSYVIDTAISADGKRIAIVSVKSVDGAYLAEFQLSIPGEDQALATITMSGVFPQAVRFFANNHMAVLCENALYFYSDEGEKLGEYAFLSDVPSRFALDGDTAAMVFPNNIMGTESRVLCLDSMGETLDEAVFDGRAQAVVLGKDALYLLTEHNLYRLSLTHGDTTVLEYAGGGKAIFPTDDGVLLCTASTAYRYPVSAFSARTESMEDTD